MTNLVQVSRQNGLMEIHFNRPDRKNALSNEMYTRVSEALEEANQDNAIRCILITGSDTAFTAGNDLKEFLSDPPVTQDAPVFRMLRALVANEKVLIAAVNGLAVGIGTTMLLHCDLVVAVTGARFQLPFINLAIVPEAASSLLLPRLIGHQRTMELLLLGEPFTAEVAQSYGLVNRVVPLEELLPTARALANQILQKPPKALRLLKRLVVEDADVILTRMKEENIALGAQLASHEGMEAVAALIEKRPPNFVFS
jgi:enoyl-CoA hydratase/carnithine racemase